VAEIKVTLWASVAMLVTTSAMLMVGDPILVGVSVFVAGLAMAPMFPTTLGICGNVFTKMTATAMGIVITSGWIGLTLSSYIIGFVADRADLNTALLLLPAMSLLLIVVNVLLRTHLSSPAAA